MRVEGGWKEIKGANYGQEPGFSINVQHWGSQMSAHQMDPPLNTKPGGGEPQASCLNVKQSFTATELIFTFQPR